MLWLGGGGVGLGVRESTVTAFTTRNLHFSELGVGVPLFFFTILFGVTPYSPNAIDPRSRKDNERLSFYWKIFDLKWGWKEEGHKKFLLLHLFSFISLDYSLIPKVIF